MYVLVRYSNHKGKLIKKAIVYTRNEHCIDSADVDSDALRIITYLRSIGFEAYLVGGAVRDLLLKKKPKDFDIVTNASPQRLKRLFRNSRIIGRRFRLVHIFYGSKIFEVSTFRSLCDGTVGNSFGTMDEDVQRRDFTLNALYYDPIKEHIIDYVGGVKDIKKKRIEPVIPLNIIFDEDPVRMIRAIKYAATSQFHLPYLVKRKIRKSAYLLANVSPSRLTEEIIKILNSGFAYDIVQRGIDTDVFMYIQPSAASLIDSSSAFSKSYQTQLQKLDSMHDSNRLGERLVHIIYTFVSLLTDWQKEILDAQNIGELYSKTWKACRQFVLPMNPPKVELEFAVRNVLKQLHVPVSSQKRRRPSQKKPSNNPKENQS